MPNQATTPVNALRQAFEARKEAQQAASGLPQPIPEAQTPQPSPMAGLQAAAPRMEMPADEQLRFAKDTGIQPNHGASDINLRVPFEELMRRADAILGVSR